MKPKLVSTILCDDVRPEVGGKMSFMGVYGDRLFVPSLPFKFPKLVLVVELRFDSPMTDGLKFSVDIMGPSHLVANVDGALSSAAESAEQGRLMITFQDFTVDEAGEHIFSLKFRETDTKFTHRLQVVQKPVAV